MDYNMAHRVSVIMPRYDDYSNTCCIPCFNNFVDIYKVYWPAEILKYNGRNIDESDYLEFDTEADYLVFKLKFG